MLYAALCYNAENVVFSWTKAEDDAVMAKLNVVHERLMREKKLGPSARLMPTTAATTLRKDTDPPIVLDCESLEEALGIVREFAKANPGGAYEVRPIRLFVPGSGVR